MGGDAFLAIVACHALLATAAGLADGRSPREAGEIALWPEGSIPDERAGAIGPETHLQRDGADEIYNVTVPTLTPYLIAEPRGAVVVAPGGGYTVLAWSKEGVDIAHWLNSIGYSAFVLKYRVPAREWLPFGMAPLEDAQRAVGLVRQLASMNRSLGIGPSTIGFIGFSAGGHLAAHVSTTCSTGAARAYPAVDGADNISCRPDFSLLIYPWQLSEHGDLHVTHAHPPTFLAQAEDDPVAPVLSCSLSYYSRLKMAGAAPSELHIYPAGGHGYGRCTVGESKQMKEEVCRWDDRAARFLNATGDVASAMIMV